ncbi:iron-hydroxamate ABC transporter substrate-binding protein [Paenibacillus abyssi]|uniref:Iron-hydroxamate ABC transporter substrate-binding protein n=1 Tax=Paenibacillus abyssi TaxID=1340531 RepID=A0A917G4B6_9BACL|nr:iron-hydroxamate ABC transporter substrate-binding protein [Paenibacillus abyssi]GGG22543.1 iron-hydroxamate ABC transporter substrate-binding protein [Paenibacillus abyssi]
MKKTFMLLLSILLIVILSACGQQGGQAAEQASSAETGNAAADGEPRIASLSIHLTNNLLALGITPVGSVVGGELKTFLPHVADRLTDTKPLGTAADPDMETLLALKPDVIYVDEQLAGDISRYEKIAKTQVFNLDEGTWRDHLEQIGELVNREQEAEDFIKDNQAQAERVKKLIHDKIGDGTAMGVRVTAKELRVFGLRRPMGPMLFEDLGLKPASGVEKINRDKSYEVISQEVLPDFNADAIFVVVNNQDGAKKLYEQLQDSPIWQGLKAVKANQVYMIPDQPWLDYSALGNKMSLDQAEQMFLK